MLPVIRMPRRRPSRGTSDDTRTTGRPVMGQLSPKKVLDDARPTESTNLEPQPWERLPAPRGGDHPGCRGGRRGSGRATPTLARRAIAGRSARERASRPSSLNLVFNCQRATFVFGLRQSSSGARRFSGAELQSIGGVCYRRNVPPNAGESAVLRRRTHSNSASNRTASQLCCRVRVTGRGQ